MPLSYLLHTVQTAEHFAEMESGPALKMETSNVEGF